MSKQGNPTKPVLRTQARSVRNRNRILTGRANVPRGGTTRAPSGATVTHDLSIWKPTVADPWDHNKASHLMRRAGFGAAPSEIDSVVKIGMDRTVDLLVIPSNWGIQPLGTVRLPHGEVLNLTRNLTNQRALWVYEAANTVFPLKEKMAVFWHDHWSVGANGGIQVALLPTHINLFRQHGLGSFRDMVVAVTRDPAMLYWLDNRLNGRRGLINENYGRELLELYTQGEGRGYTETDVREASRCLAGWSLNGYDRYRYISSYYQNVAKKVLGKTIYNPTNREQEGYELIDHLMTLDNTARFIVEKIWAYFVSQAPYPALTTELARRWKLANYNIRLLMSLILRCNYFYSSKGMRSLVKNPMEYVVGAMRTLGSPVLHRHGTVGFRIEQIGLPLLRYSNPAGLDDGVAWIDTASLITRTNIANELTLNSTTAGVRVNWDPFTELDRAGAKTDVQIVDHYLKYMVDGTVPTQVRTNLITFMNRANFVPINFNNFSRFNQRQKIRGLVHVIMALPEYHVN